MQLLEWWNELAYLGFRESVVVNSSPAVGYPPQPHGDRTLTSGGWAGVCDH